MDSQEANLFTRKEKLFAVAFIAMLLIAVGYIAVKIEHNSEQTLAKQVSATYVEQVFNSLAEITGATSSLSTLYRVASEYGSDDLDQHAAELVTTKNSIASIGRYDHIYSNDLDSFAGLMAERGIYRFELKSLNADGSASPAAGRDHHEAVVSVSPFDPRAARLIGVDLAYDKSVSDGIEKASRNNQHILTAYPVGWPQKADALLFVPTYAGRYIPDTAESRLAQRDGGYYIEVSFSALLQEAENLNARINIPGKSLVNKSAETTSESRYMRSIFKGQKVRIKPFVGGTQIGVKIDTGDGISKTVLLSALLWVFVWLSLAIIALLVIAQKRKSDLGRKLAQKHLEQERKIALTTLEAINDSVFTLASTGQISYVNPAGEAMLSKAASELLGVSVKDAIPVAHGCGGNKILREIETTLQAESPTILKDIDLLTQVSVTQVDCSFTPFGADAGGVMVMRDVGKERALTKKLEHLATHDSLTGLHNRYYFELRLEEIVQSATEKGESHAVCYIDMDQFKIVNDTCGHQAGDKLLVKLANHLQENTRSGDVLARLGGDEFGLLIKNCPEKECELIAKKLHDTLQSFYFIHGQQQFAIRACFGFVAINSACEHVADVMAAADIACYSAKDRGRNEMFVFRSDCEETSQRQGEMHMLPKLQNALSVDRFVLFVQPIAKILSDGYDDTCKYEILLRMLDDNGSLITPFQLISAAERYDLMIDVDRWVINRAFHEIADLHKMHGDDLPIFAINLSGQSVLDPDLVSYILSKVDETEVPADKLCFEITETSAMGDLTQAQALLEFLHSIGSTVALDDFGAGECSFGYLEQLPVDTLKIDGQFVKDLNKLAVHREMVVFAGRVAKLLNMQTVAEFVENEDILNTLRELDIDYAQGFHISKPFDMTELKERGEFKKAA